MERQERQPPGFCRDGEASRSPNPHRESNRPNVLLAAWLFLIISRQILRSHHIVAAAD